MPKGFRAPNITYCRNEPVFIDIYVYIEINSYKIPEMKNFSPEILGTA